MKKNNDFYEKLKNELEAFDVEKAFPDELKKDNIVNLLSQSRENTEDKVAEIVPISTARRAPSLRKLSAVAAAVVVIIAVGVVTRNFRVFEEPAESEIFVEEEEKAATDNKISKFFSSVVRLIYDGEKDGKAEKEGASATKRADSKSVTEPSATQKDGKKVSTTVGKEQGTDVRGEMTTAAGKENQSEKSNEEVGGKVTLARKSTTRVRVTKDFGGTIVGKSVDNEEWEIAPIDNEQFDDSIMLKGDSTMFSYVYGEDVSAYYTAQNPWRNADGTDATGTTAELYCDCLTLNFKSGDKELKLQMSKGQYGSSFIGAQAGLLEKTISGESIHYNDAVLPVEITVYNAGETDDNATQAEKLLTRKSVDSSWVSGYISGRLAKVNDRSGMSAEFKITLPDEATAAAFISELTSKGFVKAEESGVVKQKTYTLSGTEVCFVW